MEPKTLTVEVDVIVERAPEYDYLYDNDDAWIVTEITTLSLPSVDEILPGIELELYE